MKVADDFDFEIGWGGDFEAGRLEDHRRCFLVEYFFEARNGCSPEFAVVVEPGAGFGEAVGVSRSLPCRD